jgi:hypothetical protein
MKLIKDLGISYASGRCEHIAIYECPVCGRHFETKMSRVKCGGAKTCGCLRTLKPGRLKHGLSRTKLYKVRTGMIQRCYNKNHNAYPYYGGRGITVCKEWLDDVMAFVNWSMENGYEEGLTVDRIDRNKGYSPDNCRLVTFADNMMNQQKHKNNTSGYKGVFRDGKKWLAGIGFRCKFYRLGWFNTPEEAALAYNKFVIENKTYHPLNVIKEPNAKAA